MLFRSYILEFEYSEAKSSVQFTIEEPEPTPVTPPETSGFYWGAIVELDKIYYSLKDDINIIVTAPNFNTNSNAIEYIDDTLKVH